jgi:ribosomal protein S18 acetylase RimI-like enzyme
LTSGPVTVDGASCHPGPSPSAKATRLDQLRATDPSTLAALAAAVGEGALDAALAPDDPLVPMLIGIGFTPYATTVVMARRLDGFRKEPAPPGVKIEPYQNDWAESFTRAESLAMADFPFYREVGSPTGFEGAAGWGAFVAARRGDEIVGFAQAALPDGWINWIGVVPDERRQGIARALLGEIAVAVRDAVGSHLVCEVNDTADDIAFWEKQGFRQRTRSVSLIRR